MNPLVPAAVLGGLLAIAGLAARQAASAGPVADQALADRDAAGGSSPKGSGFTWVARRLAPLGRRVFGETYTDRMRHQLLRAGSPQAMSVTELLGRKLAMIVLATLVVVALVLTGRALLGVVVLVLGLVFHDAWLYSLASRRRTRIEKDLPDLLDVLAVTLTAGIPFRRGLGRVVVLTDGALAEEMSTTLREIDFGISRRRSFENLRYRNEGSQPVSDLVAGVLQAEELGVPLVEAVVALTADMRRSQEQNLRRRVARVEARVAAVTSLLVLPAAIVLIAAALWLSSDIDLAGFLGG